MGHFCRVTIQVVYTFISIYETKRSGVSVNSDHGTDIGLGDIRLTVLSGKKGKTVQHLEQREKGEKPVVLPTLCVCSVGVHSQLTAPVTRDGRAFRSTIIPLQVNYCPGQ